MEVSGIPDFNRDKHPIEIAIIRWTATIFLLATVFLGIFSWNQYQEITTIKSAIATLKADKAELISDKVELVNALQELAALYGQSQQSVLSERKSVAKTEKIVSTLRIALTRMTNSKRSLHIKYVRARTLMTHQRQRIKSLNRSMSVLQASLKKTQQTFIAGQKNTISVEQRAAFLARVNHLNTLLPDVTLEKLAPFGITSAVAVATTEKKIELIFTFDPKQFDPVQEIHHAQLKKVIGIATTADTALKGHQLTIVVPPNFVLFQNIDETHPDIPSQPTEKRIPLQKLGSESKHHATGAS